MENEANEANVTELETRIDRLTTKLRDLVPGSAAHAEVVENIEDYYERLVQIKQMRVSTLEEELREANEREDNLKLAATSSDNNAFFLAFICALLFSMYIETLFPGAISLPLSGAIYLCLNTTMGTVTITAIAVHLVTKHLYMYNTKIKND